MGECYPNPNVAVIFNSDNIAAIYQLIISVAKLQFNIKDFPALKATSESVISDDQDSSTKGLNFRVTGIKNIERISTDSETGTRQQRREIYYSVWCQRVSFDYSVSYMVLYLSVLNSRWSW